MIFATGLDLCDIRRVEKLLARGEAHAARFMRKYFTAAEIAYAQTKTKPAATLAKRWAAKEACAKALGTGIGGGVRLQDIEVVLDGNGKPSITLYGAATEKLQSLSTQPLAIHLALTDEYPYALAQVMIVAL